MTAPASPQVRIKQFGGSLRLAWREVDGATDYNVYLGDRYASVALEDSISDAEGLPNGWFVWWSGVVTGTVFVKVTALNALAEESSGITRGVLISSDADLNKSSADRPPIPMIS